MPSKDSLCEKAERTSADRMQPLQSSAVSTQPKPVLSSAEIMRSRMAFFSVPSQPVRINARAFLGLEPTPLPKPAEQEQEIDDGDVSDKLPVKEEKPVEVANEKSPASAKEPEANRKRHGRNEPVERAKRWRKRRKKRRVTGHVTGGAVAEKHAALPVVSIEGVSSDEDEEEDLVNVGDDAIDQGPELEMEDIPTAGDVDEIKGDSVGDAAENIEQVEADASSELPDKRCSSLDEVVSLEDKRQQSEVTVGQESPEETSVTICDAIDDLSESGSEIVDELCVGGDDDDDEEEDDANETEYLVDGRTINYNKLFAEEESESRGDFEDDLCDEEQQQVVNDVVSSFREIGDAQPPSDVADLPLTQSEERLLMFGWKEGVEDDDGDRLEEDVTKDKISDVPKVDENTVETYDVFRDPGKDVALEGKDDRVEIPASAADTSLPLSGRSGLSDQPPPSESPDQPVVAAVATEKRAPRAEVDSFSDDDLELCITVPSSAPAPVEVTPDVAVEKEVPTADESQNLDTSNHLDSLVAATTSDSADVVLANVDSSVCQETVSDVPKTELNGDVKLSAVESVQMSMQSLPLDSSQRSAQPTGLLKINTVPLCIEKTGSVEKKEDLQGATSPVVLREAPLSADSSQLAKLDPITRIDRLLESLSSSKVGPISPSLLMPDDVFVLPKQQSGKPEAGSDFTKAENSVSPASRLDWLADASVSDRSAELSDIRDESRIVEFKVEDESGTEHAFRVDESFVSTRDKRQYQFSEKESLSDLSFTATTDSAADPSITSRNADESSSSGTQEVATCPAALMAATDDSLSLDRLASFSFDDILSADGEDESQESAGVESWSRANDRHSSSEPVCNGGWKGETEPVCTQPENDLRATVIDPAAGKDSPPVVVVSPSRLVDAKRRFFCEPPQPVRIDPRRVFDEIPATSSTKAISTPRDDSAQHASRNVSSGKPVNGLTSKAPATVENTSSDASLSDRPRRRVLPAVPSDQLQLDASELTLSPEELALIQNTQQSGEKNSAVSSQSPATVDDATLVRRRSHRSEKKRPSSALVVTATERDKIMSSGPSSVVRHPTSSAAKSSAVLQRQSSHSDSTTDGSPSQRRERLWAFHRPKSKIKVPAGELMGGGDTENSGGSERKEKRRSLLAILMPSKSLDRREKSSKDLPVSSPQPTTGDVATVEPSVDRTEIIAAIREKTKSLPLEKKKLPSSETAKRSSLEKQRSKSSKSRGSKKSAESEGDGRSKQTQRTVYEEMAPIIEGIKRVERRNREKVNIHERIRAVAPPPAKAPFTALLPPKADSKC